MYLLLVKKEAKLSKETAKHPFNDYESYLWDILCKKLRSNKCKVRFSEIEQAFHKTEEYRQDYIKKNFNNIITNVFSRDISALQAIINKTTTMTDIARKLSVK
mmetsp:Transcript_20062/g.17757  ORF Transcript_20062/g.17757 Transcript_20062/m.17757 type:complete len:103 (+) Transcript_20062:237-545(+)